MFQSTGQYWDTILWFVDLGIFGRRLHLDSRALWHIAHLIFGSRQSVLLVILCSFMCLQCSCKASLEQAEQHKAAAETKLAGLVEKKAHAAQMIEAIDEQATAIDKVATAAAEVLNKTAAAAEARAAVAAAQLALQSNSSSPVLNAKLDAAEAVAHLLQLALSFPMLHADSLF